MSDTKPILVSIDPRVFVVTHRCREWRLNVYRRWKAMQKGKS